MGTDVFYRIAPLGDHASGKMFSFPILTRYNVNQSLPYPNNAERHTFCKSSIWLDPISNLWPSTGESFWLLPIRPLVGLLTNHLAGNDNSLGFNAHAQWRVLPPADRKCNAERGNLLRCWQAAGHTQWVIGNSLFVVLLSSNIYGHMKTDYDLLVGWLLVFYLLATCKVILGRVQTYWLVVGVLHPDNI